MSLNFKESADLVHKTFQEIANHEMRLATNLQSLLPTNKQAPNPSAEYLYEHALMMKEMTEQLKDLMLPLDIKKTE